MLKVGRNLSLFQQRIVLPWIASADQYLLSQRSLGTTTKRKESKDQKEAQMKSKETKDQKEAQAESKESKDEKEAPTKAKKEVLTTTDKQAPEEKIIAAVALERLPLVVPLPLPEIEAFRKFSSEWQDQYRRQYPKEFIDSLSSSNEREDNAYELKFEPGPRITEADKKNDRKSLQRALDRRLFFIVQGYPLGRSKDKLVWHFPERLYKNEETLRLCAESVLIPTVAKAEDVYYVGNAPCGHFCESHVDAKSGTSTLFKRFFFRSQVLGKLRLKGGNYKDYAWVTKEELLEYFELDMSVYMKQMLVDDLRVIY